MQRMVDGLDIEIDSFPDETAQLPPEYLTFAPDRVKAPFDVIVDTREQIPYTFHEIPIDNSEKYYGVSILRRGLTLGDYSVAGLETRLCIERKSLEDLYSSIGRRDNFENRLTRMQGYDYSCVVVEASQETLLSRKPHYLKQTRSKLTPRMVFRTIQAWTMDYPRTHWWFMDERQQAEIMTFRLMARFHRKNKHLIDTGLRKL